jgi:hypothetical protein
MRVAPVAWLAVGIGCMLISLLLLVLGVRNVFSTALIGAAAVWVLVCAARFLISGRTL